LGVSRSDSCDYIQKTYRRKAIKYHPDHGGDVDFFAKMTHAKDVLGNPQTRAVYDAYGEDGIK